MTMSLTLCNSFCSLLYNECLDPFQEILGERVSPETVCDMLQSVNNIPGNEYVTIKLADTNCYTGAPSREVMSTSGCMPQVLLQPV